MTTVTTIGGQPQGGAMDMWKASLCGCFDDCGSCCLGLWCPCFLYGFNKQSTTGEGCCVPCCIFTLLYAFFPPVMPCVMSSNRTTVRQVYNLPPQPCDDCCTYCFCMACALCQEARELKLRDANAANPAMNQMRQQGGQQMVVVTQAPQVVAAPAASAPPATGQPAEGVFKV